MSLHSGSCSSLKSSNQELFCGKGGRIYGDKFLNVLYLGSGGGSGGNDNALNDNPKGGRYCQITNSSWQYIIPAFFMQ